MGQGFVWGMGISPLSHGCKSYAACFSGSRESGRLLCYQRGPGDSECQGLDSDESSLLWVWGPSAAFCMRRGSEEAHVERDSKGSHLLLSQIVLPLGSASPALTGSSCPGPQAGPFPSPQGDAVWPDAWDFPHLVQAQYLWAAGPFSHSRCKKRSTPTCPQICNLPQHLLSCCMEWNLHVQEQCTSHD